MAGVRQQIGRSGSGASAGDIAVMMTGDDAAVSKLAAVEKGHFVTRPQNRAPIINRGHYCRVSRVRSLLFQFLKASAAADVSQSDCQPRASEHAAGHLHSDNGRTHPSSAETKRESGQNEQIVSLGGGLDSTFFYLKSSGSAPRGGFFEVDLPAVVAAKKEAIQRSDALMSMISKEPKQEADRSEVGLVGGGYALVAADLRDSKAVEAALVGAGLDLAAPTLLLSECVLIYMPPEAGTALITWAAAAFTTAAFVTYEQVHPHDAFGATMVKNIAARGCPLQAIMSFPDCQAQARRYREAGWGACECVTMRELYDAWTPEAEKARVGRVEIFDEVEEWNLIQDHYCIACATVDKGGSGFWGGFSPRVLLDEESRAPA